jgi:hypothetical protein
VTFTVVAVRTTLLTVRSWPQGRPSRNTATTPVRCRLTRARARAPFGVSRDENRASCALVTAT